VVIKDKYVANLRYGPTRVPGKYSLNTIYESQEEKKGGSPHEKPKNSSKEGNFVMHIFVCHLSRSCVRRMLVRVSGYSKRSAYSRIEKRHTSTGRLPSQTFHTNCENEKSAPRTMRPLLSSRLALTWSSDAPTVASGTKKKSNDMRELSRPGGAGH
jgi:hypothetical protein